MMNSKKIVFTLVVLLMSGLGFTQQVETPGGTLGNSGNGNTGIGDEFGNGGNLTPEFELEVQGGHEPTLFTNSNWGKAIRLLSPDNTTRGSALVWDKNSRANHYFVAGPQSGNGWTGGDYFTGLSTCLDNSCGPTYIYRIDGNYNNSSPGPYGGGDPRRGHTQYYRDLYLLSNTNTNDGTSCAGPRLGIGVGEANTTANLHVKGRVRFEDLDCISPGSLDMYLGVDANGYVTYAPLSGGGSLINNCSSINQVPRTIDAMGNLDCGQITDDGTNVGISNLNPLQNLHVSGNVLIDGANSSLLFGETAGASNVGDYGIEYQEGDKGLNIWKPWGSTDNSGGQGFQNNILFLNDDGEIGMGVDPTVLNASGYDYKLSVCGKIRAEEVIVETSWCDYVFEPDYKLRSLDDLEKFIKEHKHLPEIPSEAVVKENGVNLGEVESKLLLKVEELTLYVIELNKQNLELSDQVSKLMKLVDEK